jgi:Transposase domain (DUF772).
MYKKSESKQGDLFKDVQQHLSNRKKNELTNPQSWQNVFYENVFCNIDEDIFSVLYSLSGRPNASIREIICMIVLKEGNGWSDEQLFDQCDFNLKIMWALGLHNIDDSVPSPSTYYDFRKRLTDYQKSNGGDLLKKCFNKVTSNQVSKLKISGLKVRLDSKLINSNIALVDRTSMILEAIRVFIQPLELVKIKRKISSRNYELLEKLKTKSTSNIIYTLSKAENENLLDEMGKIIQQLKKSYGGAKHIKALKRIYKEQYYEVEEKIENNKQTGGKNQKKKNGGKGTNRKKRSKKYLPQLKESKDVAATSVQSIHDTDAAFRRKGKGKDEQVISGYHANITEVYDDKKVNLIVDTQVAKANVNENEFLIPSLDNSQQVLHQGDTSTGKATKIEVATMDGGYDSVENRQELSKEERPGYNITKFKGRKRRFDIKVDKTGVIRVYDKQLKKRCKLTYSKKTEKHIINYGNNEKRYFTQEELNDYILLCKINIDPTAVSERANVESTIHQVFHRLEKRNKIRYRSIEKCNLYVISRVLWVNFKRILKNEVSTLIFRILTFYCLMEQHNFKNQNITAHSP